MSIKEMINSTLTKLVTKEVLAPDRSNIGRKLYEIYLWQEISKRAKSELDNSWKTAQSPGGQIDKSDEVLRKLDRGEHIVCESNHFSVLVKIDTPRKTFDLEEFITIVSKKYKVPADKLTAMAEACKKDGTAPLTKRVIEANNGK
jgi:hypothetical protein